MVAQTQIFINMFPTFVSGTKAAGDGVRRIFIIPGGKKMTKVTLKQIEVNNFKGCAHALHVFSPGVTTISGRNATGKTTIMDAYLWCLTGRNSEDSAKFSVKPHDGEGVAASQQEHAVTVTVDVNGEVKVFERRLREDWQRKRGSDFSEFAGNKTAYTINGAPVAQKDFDAEVEKMCPASIYKIISNPTYFNTLKVSERRDLLMRIVPEITDKHIAEQFEDQDSVNTANKLIGEHSGSVERAIKAQQKIRKDTLDAIDQVPARIDEVKRQIAQVGAIDEIRAKNEHDWAGGQVKSLQKQLHDLDFEETKLWKRKELEQEQNKLAALEQDYYQTLQDSFLAAKQVHTELQSELSGLMTNKRIYESDCDVLQKLIDDKNDKIEVLRQEFRDVSAAELDLSNVSNTCPTCKQALPEDEIAKTEDQYKSDFVASKARQLEVNRQKGLEVKKQIDKLTADWRETQQKLVVIDKRIDELNKLIPESKIIVEKSEKEKSASLDTKEASDLRAKIQELSEKARSVGDSAARNQIEEKLTEMQNKFYEAKIQVSKMETLKQYQTRITELEIEGKRLGSMIGASEYNLKVLDDWNRERCLIMERYVNQNFTKLKWRLFVQQVNGGMADDCTALIDGVPYSDANHAAQVNAGIEIIDVMSKRLGVSLPVWIDNAEAVNEIITLGQQVRLVVTESEKLSVIT